MAAQTSRFLLLSLVAALALSACGGGGDGGSAKSYESVAALARDLGCGGAVRDKGAAEVTEEGHCQLDGEHITVAIWPDGVRPKEPPGVASPFGGDWVVLGKNWTVVTVTAGGAKKVQDKIGGKLQ